MFDWRWRTFISVEIELERFPFPEQQKAVGASSKSFCSNWTRFFCSVFLVVQIKFYICSFFIIVRFLFLSNDFSLFQGLNALSAIMTLR